MATIISNQAVATYVYDGVQSRSATSNVANTTLLDNYGLEVSKQNYQQCFRPGENITFSIKVTNTGCRRLCDFIVEDDLARPTGGTAPLTYVTGTARISIGGEFREITPTVTDPLTFNIGDGLDSGDSFVITYVATVDENISEGYFEIINTANVSAGACCENNSERYTASDSSTLPRCTDAFLTITKAVSKSTICSCDNYQYILTLVNNGIVDATNVVVTDYLPTGFTVDSIRVENEDTIHDYDPSEYDIDASNFLTLPNVTGTVINVRSVEPGNNHATTVYISGSFNA